MKKMIILVLVSVFGFCAEFLDVRILKEIDFNNGYGIIEAEPILKGVREKVKLRGDYNTGQNGNVVFSFSKVEVDGRIYTLSEPFIKKSRLKNPKTAKLSKGSRIQVSEGSKSEILDILNRKRENQIASHSSLSSPSQSPNNQQNQSNKRSDFIASTPRSSNSSNNPYLYHLGNTQTPFKKEDDRSSPTTNSDGTCKAPSIKNGLVSVYSAVAGTCKLLTATEDAIYIKSNQPTCQNIVDYENGEIRVGEEKFVTMEDNKEYKVGSCSYSTPIKLSSEIGSCKAIPDYQKGEALIQKQYFYTRNNQRVNVGGCTPAKEYTLLSDDVNACKYRYDFIANFAIKQTQYFFISENKRYDVGECVDKKGESFKYPLFEDDTTCNFDVSNDRVFYQKRLAFMDLTGGKQFATDCRVIASDGHEIYEEFDGYDFSDLSKQAIRKVNQYFIVPGTQNVKKYIAKGARTNKAYRYQERLCRWEHDDEKKISKRLSTIFFIDTDENKEVMIQECSDVTAQFIAYAYAGEESRLVGKLTGKTLIPEGDSWKIYGTENLISNIPNATRNVSIIAKTQCGDVANSYTAEQRASLNIQESKEWVNQDCITSSNGTSCSNVYSYQCTIQTKPNYGTNQVIEQEEIKKTWLRGDGSKYQDQSKIQWRAK